MKQRNCDVQNYILLIGYIVGFLFPITLALSVSSIGKYYSNVGAHWQLENISLVAMSTTLAAITAVATGYFVQNAFIKIIKDWDFFCRQRFYISDRIVFGGIALVSSFGLFHSFGGTIFEKIYIGPVRSWLGVGAWSVLFNLTLFLLICDYLRSNKFTLMLFALYILIMSPILLCGSRIDFLSGTIGFVVFSFIDTRNPLRTRIIQICAMMLIIVIILYSIGVIRYSMGHPGFSAQDLFQPTVQVDGNNKIYLSTVGDIAASVHQAVGQLEHAYISEVGIWGALYNYSVRLLPGTFFPDRPGDLLLLLPELPGGGALHPLGEGYLIGRMVGIMFIAGIVGIIVGCSIAARAAWQKFGHPFFGLIFIFPWLLLIRGGWYQFFAFLKGIEIIAFLLVILVVMEYIRYGICKK